MQARGFGHAPVFQSRIESNEMKLSRILCIAALGFSSVLGAQASPATVSPQVDEVSSQILLELQFAPKEVLGKFAADERSLQEFIVGRLQDMEMAELARKRGLDQTPEFQARRLLDDRSELVKALVGQFQEAERANLPEMEPLARQRYQATRQQYALPEQIRVAHILLMADVEKLSEEEIAQQRAKAQSLKARLDAGEDFAELAREFSEEKSTAEKGGELPRATARGSFVPPFEKAAWELKEGEVSEVVRTRFGYHIIKLLERKPASYRDFEQVRAGLERNMENEILAPRRSAFVDSFRGPALDAKAAVLLPDVQQGLKKLLAREP